LGIGTTEGQNVPVRVGTETDWVTVAPGLVHNLALKADGSLWAWGQNGNGPLGDGTAGDSSDFNRANKSAPVQIGTAKDWESISAGYNHSLALKKDGSLWGWGANFSGELGDGTSKGIRKIPGRIGESSDWRLVRAGASHSVAIKTDCSLWIWGYNSFGQIGDGLTTNRELPVQIGIAKDWVWASGGVNYTIGLKRDGSLWAWGEKLVPPEHSKMKVQLAGVLSKLKIQWKFSPLKKMDATPVQIGDLGTLPQGQ
jgi:alpha-tubulin suppressor-like RCC1 family protein